VFEQNKGMLLRSSDIVASKINWEKKSENLVQLSKELNLGLDGFLFIDDNPVECAEVASLGSGISVVNLPEDKSWNVLLKNIWRLDSRRVTKEDKKRSAFYKSDYQRENLKHKATSFYDFIVNLGLKLKFSKLSNKDIGRASQLSQRTNQFNLAANRYYEDDLQKMMNTVSGNLMCTVSAKDRFGDYGIIGFLVCSLNTSNDALNIDGLFLSCRILGRGAEFSILSHIIK